MPVVPIRDLGALGIIKDQNPSLLPPNAFSDGMNVRFNNKKVERAPIFRTFFTGLTGTAPVFSYGLYNQGGYDSLLYANNDGRVFQVANGTETNVTEVAHVNNVDTRSYTAMTLGQSTFLNRPDMVPRVLTPGASAFVTLPNWNSTWRAVALRSFKQFGVALNLTKGATNYPNLVHWSDTTTNGTYPDSWDETDTTKLAGENPLEKARTPIVDGGELGDVFIIYTRDEVYRMTYIGGTFLFDFQRLPFDNAGLINQNCWVEVDGKHYAWSDSDIYVHDGVGKQSIIDQLNRETFFKELNQSSYGVCFVAHDKYHNEILFCGVSGDVDCAIPHPTGYCNYAAVYNYRNQTWSFRDLPNASSATTANANTVYTWTTVPSNLTWDNTGGSWYDQEDSFSRFCMFTVVLDTVNSITASKIDVLDFADKGKIALPRDADSIVNPTAFAERIGIEFDQEGADLRAYKQLRAIMPLAQAIQPLTVFNVKIGGHNYPAENPSYDPQVSFNPTTQYKINTRRGARFIGLRFTMPTPNDFEVAGLDFDIVITGRR